MGIGSSTKQGRRNMYSIYMYINLAVVGITYALFLHVVICSLKVAIYVFCYLLKFCDLKATAQVKHILLFGHSQISY